MMSGLTCYDCVIGDGNLPEFKPAESNTKAIAVRNLKLPDIPLDESPHPRWRALQDTLAVLDDINPVVASWVRYHHANGSLIFITGEGKPLDSKSPNSPTNVQAVAKYDYLNHKLYISTVFYYEKNDRRAALLCHEYRHSRQNVGKFFRYMLSHAFTRGGSPDIIENDACLYENEALKAIYGEQGSPNETDYDSPAQKYGRQGFPLHGTSTDGVGVLKRP